MMTASWGPVPERIEAIRALADGWNGPLSLAFPPSLLDALERVAARAAELGVDVLVLAWEDTVILRRAWKDSGPDWEGRGVEFNLWNTMNLDADWSYEEDAAFFEDQPLDEDRAVAWLTGATR